MCTALMECPSLQPETPLEDTTDRKVSFERGFSARDEVWWRGGFVCIQVCVCHFSNKASIFIYL